MLKAILLFAVGLFAAKFEPVKLGSTCEDPSVTLNGRAFKPDFNYQQYASQGSYYFEQLFSISPTCSLTYDAAIPISGLSLDGNYLKIDSVTSVPPVGTYSVVITPKTPSGAAITGVATLTITVIVVPDPCEPPTSVIPTQMDDQTYQQVEGGYDADITIDYFTTDPPECYLAYSLPA